MVTRIREPALSRHDEEDRRFYDWTGEWPSWLPPKPIGRFWSVTTLLSAGMPKFLAAHYAKRSSDLALDYLEAHGRRWARTLLRELAQHGRDDLEREQAHGRLLSIDASKLTPRDFQYRHLAGAAPRYRDSAGDRGSAVHEVAEDIVLEIIGQVIQNGLDPTTHRIVLPKQLPHHSEEVDPYIHVSFRAFIEDFAPWYFLTEASVFSRFGYAGTLDAGLEIIHGGKRIRVLVDYTTSAGVYPDKGLQVTAYRRADFIGLPDGTAIKLPEFDKAAVLYLTPEGRYPYALRFVDTGDPVYRVFLNVCEVGRWFLPSDGYPKGIAATVLGKRVFPDSADSAERLGPLPDSLW